MSNKLTREQKSEIFLENIAGHDCGVIAIQAVTGLSRGQAESLADRFGYVVNVGISRGEIEKALKSIGAECVNIDVGYNETPAIFAQCRPQGKFLVYTHNHVSALVAGDLHNARGAWGAPIEQITEVT